MLLDGNQLDNSIETVNFHLINPMISLLRLFCDKFIGEFKKPYCYDHIEMLISDLSDIKEKSNKQPSKPSSVMHIDSIFGVVSPPDGISEADTSAALTLMGMRSKPLCPLSEQPGLDKPNHGFFAGHDSQGVPKDKSPSSIMSFKY